MISFRERRFINFRHFAFSDPRDHGRRWVDVKCFEVGALASGDESVLRALFGDKRFIDDYAGGGLDTAGQIHGPYQLGLITVDAYERIDAMAAISILDAWARQYGSVPADLDEALKNEVCALISSAGSCYRLKALGDGAFHDWGGVHTDFHELVAIDRVAGAVALIVAADD